jgi:hypothetical protein
MEKRIHTKRPNILTYRHYLFHFKWSLLGFLIFLLIVSCIQMNIASIVYPLIRHDTSIGSTNFEFLYPIGDDKHNRSITYHLERKDELKTNDDRLSMESKQKVIQPLMRKKSSANSYTILEYTPVFGKPRFCSHTRQQIFGETCPYTNW